MDWLYQRYASPFSFMNQMLRCGRFADFVTDFQSIIETEKEEKAQWEVWLHKVFDISYTDFKQGIKDTKQNMQMTANDVGTTIQESKDILNNFKPS